MLDFIAGKTIFVPFQLDAQFHLRDTRKKIEGEQSALHFNFLLHSIARKYLCFQGYGKIPTIDIPTLFTKSELDKVIKKLR